MKSLGVGGEDWWRGVGSQVECKGVLWGEEKDGYSLLGSREDVPGG